MGTIFQFLCSGCGYEVEVSGGIDCGRKSVTVTILCPSCKELRDVCISNEPEKALLPDVSGIRPDYDYVLECKKCKGRSVTPWYTPGPCPKCGITMDCVEPVIDWD